MKTMAMTLLVFVLAVPISGADPQSSCQAPTANQSPPIIAQYQGCCSWHGGVCGCYGWRVLCCDGRLSPSCTCKDGRPTPSPVAEAEQGVMP